MMVHVDEIQRLILALQRDPDTRSKARVRLIEIGAPAVGPLLQAVQSEHGPQAWIAADLLGELRDPRALPALIDALRVSNATLSSMAVKSLLRFDNLDPVPILIDALPHAHLMTQQTIVLALKRLADGRALFPLLDYLAGVESPTLRCGVIQALGALGDPRAIPAIQQWIDDEDHHVREWAVIALQQLSEGGKTA
jgi:HEAT repeat protein